MNTFLKSVRTEENQKTAEFTGEGAYHGSTKPKIRDLSIPEEIPEVIPSTLIDYWKRKDPKFQDFLATFVNLYQVKKVLPEPSQDEIKDDGVTFVWSPFEEAKREAGPLTKKVLEEMENHLERKKKFVYIDSKIQFFHKGDLAVDSKLWHVDGTIAVRDQRAADLGYNILHDMRARILDFDQDPPKYLAYQSSQHCATQFINRPLSFRLPACIPNFNILDDIVREIDPPVVSQPAGSIVSFNGLSLHRAVPATADGWRLWIRCTETDREIKLNSAIINCYGTVFKQ